VVVLQSHLSPKSIFHTENSDQHYDQHSLS